MIDLLFWRVLRYSGIFNYWYRKHLTELLFDLERFDIESEQITKKYREKLGQLK